MMIAEKVLALLDGLDSAELDRMRPADRRKLAALCHHWWQLAEHRDKQRAAGVLSKLADGERAP